MTYQQVELSNQKSKQVCWLEDSKPFKLGDYIRFKDGEVFWKVEHIYKVKLEKSQIHDDWQVGGIKGVMR
jgi:hypothetical protein